jgi:hypothetical protein
MWPTRIAVRRTGGEQQAVEIAVLNIEHERRGARHPGHAEENGGAHLERRVVKPRDVIDHLLQRRHIDDEEEQRNEHWGHHHCKVAWHGAQCATRD